MECRKCGACCIALSVSSLDKPAGIRCHHLTGDNRCSLWGKPERPEVCSAFRPEPSFCGSSFREALELMEALEGESRAADEERRPGKGVQPPEAGR